MLWGCPRDGNIPQLSNRQASACHNRAMVPTRTDMTMNLKANQRVSFEKKVNGKWTLFTGYVAFMDAWVEGHGRVVGRSADGKVVRFDTAHNLGMVRKFEAH